MRSLFLILLLVVSCSCSGKVKHIMLTPENSVTLRSAVTDESVDYVIREIYNLHKKLPIDEPIYLVLDSPGGSIIAGNKLIDFKKGLKGREVKTITLFAASMAASIVESFDERLAVSNGIIMFHPASANCQGNTYALKTCLEFVLSLESKLEIATAARIDMKLDKYKEMIRDEKWLLGKDIVFYNAIDRFVDIECSDSLIKKEIEITEQVFIFTQVRKVSACPFINRIDPLKK